MTQLYKYVSNYDYILEDGYIRATQLSALNDPFEAVYCEESLFELSKYFECEEDDRINLIKEIEEEKYKIGIISFTEAKDNLLMWSHYANSYQGSLIGISTTRTIFKNLFPFEGESFLPIFEGEIETVSYRKQPMYKIDMFDRDYSNISITGKEQILYEIFRQKSEEWIYEKEHRIILRLEQADKVIIENLSIRDIDLYIQDYSIVEIRENKTIFYLDRIKDNDERNDIATLLANYSKNPNNLYLFKISTSSICSLTFGENASNFHYDKYLKWKSIGYFDVYKAKNDKKTYTINFEKLYSKY